MSEPIVSGFEQIASGIYLEGLSVDRNNNIVWFSDVIGGGVHGLHQDGHIHTLNADRMWTGGLLLNNDDSVLSSGAGGIMWNNLVSGKSGWLLNKIDGVPVNGINEMIPDGTGGIYFGTCDIEMVQQGGQPRPVQIYRLTVDHEVIKVADDIGFANGIIYDSKHKRFYCNDTFSCTWVFDVKPDLSLSNKRVLIEKDDADGMALDANGNVWITGFRSSSVMRISPEGKTLDAVETPAGAITQVRFGGADMKDIYINAVPVDGGDTLKDGEIPTEKNSHMYRARSSVAGEPISRTAFNLD